MAKRPITWDPADPLGEAEGEQETRSRTDAKRARMAVEDALLRLAKELVELSPRRLEQMALAEDVLDVVHEARALENSQAKSRQLRVVRNALRNIAWFQVRSRLDNLLEHGTLPSVRDNGQPDSRVGQESQWVVRLLGEGGEALEALISQYPSADRGHLRTLVRNVQSASGERRTRAEHKLTDAVRDLLR